jgi:hypothetical protein
MRLLGSSAKKGGYEDLAAASGEARLRRAKPAPSVSGDIAEAADKVGSDRKGRKGRRDKGDRIKPNQTKSNLRGSWRVPKLDNPMGRESAEGSLVKRSQTRSNSIQPNSPRSSPVKPSQTQSNSIRRGQTESNRIKPNQTESNRIKPAGRFACPEIGHAVGARGRRNAAWSRPIKSEQTQSNRIKASQTQSHPKQSLMIGSPALP